VPLQLLPPLQLVLAPSSFVPLQLVVPLQLALVPSFCVPLQLVVPLQLALLFEAQLVSVNADPLIRLTILNPARIFLSCLLPMCSLLSPLIGAEQFCFSTTGKICLYMRRDGAAHFSVSWPS